LAKVTQPLGSSEARGAVGGYVYNTWRGIATVRARTAPQTQYTDKQRTQRAIGYNAAKRWATISQTLRDQWNHFANQQSLGDWTGNDIRISGFNWYVRIQVHRQMVGVGYADTPPTKFCLLALNAIWADPAWDVVVFTWGSFTHPNPEQYCLQLWIAGPHSPGRQPNIQDAHYSGFCTLPTSDYGWEPPGPGTYTAFWRPLRNNGMVGTFQRITFSVPAPP
jgi:hypothetical protein